MPDSNQLSLEDFPLGADVADWLQRRRRRFPVDPSEEGASKLSIVKAKSLFNSSVYGCAECVLASLYWPWFRLVLAD